MGISPQRLLLVFLEASSDAATDAKSQNYINVAVMFS